MRQVTIACVLVIAFVSSVSAEPAKLTNDQAQQVLACLQHLDGYERAVKDGQQERVVRELYKFGSGLRLSIAQNIATLKTAAAVATEANNALVKQFAKGGQRVPDDAVTEFLVEQKKLLDASSGVAPGRIKASELKLDENPIPATVLSMCWPIIDQ